MEEGVGEKATVAQSHATLAQANAAEDVDNGESGVVDSRQTTSQWKHHLY